MLNCSSTKCLIINSKQANDKASENIRVCRVKESKQYVCFALYQADRVTYSNAHTNKLADRSQTQRLSVPIQTLFFSSLNLQMCRAQSSNTHYLLALFLFVHLYFPLASYKVFFHWLFLNFTAPPFALLARVLYCISWSKLVHITINMSSPCMSLHVLH